VGRHQGAQFYIWTTATPFIYALFGATHLTADNIDLGHFSDTAFPYALGGGIDYKIARNVAFRAIQADYYATRFSANSLAGTSNTQNHFRVSTGLVFKF
jgi:opacity protein-like surface antigen